MSLPPLDRLATLALWLVWSWFVMITIHELGHVLAATLIGGAELVAVELRPWHLPYSLFAGDKHPRITLWAGPVLGSLAPLWVAAIWRRPACWFVGWFCLLANASYLLVGCFSDGAELDSVKMLRAGVPPVALWTVIAITLPPAYLKFRRCCGDVISGRTPPMSRRLWIISAVALLLLLIVQSIAAS